MTLPCMEAVSVSSIQRLFGTHSPLLLLIPLYSQSHLFGQHNLFHPTQTMTSSRANNAPQPPPAPASRASQVVIRSTAFQYACCFAYSLATMALNCSSMNAPHDNILPCYSLGGIYLLSLTCWLVASIHINVVSADRELIASTETWSVSLFMHRVVYSLSRANIIFAVGCGVQIFFKEASRNVDLIMIVAAIIYTFAPLSGDSNSLAIQENDNNACQQRRSLMSSPQTTAGTFQRRQPTPDNGV